jgi:hypothetical protein
VIPRNTQFIDGSAFQDVKGSSISIESGNERFVIREDLLIDIVDHKLIRALSNSPSVTIPCDIEILGSFCFSGCKSLKSVSFRSNSRLSRIESNAFSDSSLRSIVIPRNTQFIDGSAFQDVKGLSISIESGNERFVIREDLLIDIVDHKLIRNFSSSSSVIIPYDIEILCSFCFSGCKSLKSVSFESNSRLTRIESQTFPRLGPITIPSAVLFVAHDASPEPSQLSLCNEDSCPEFGRWRRVRQWGITVDFRRIVRGGACGCGCPRIPLDLAAFEEGSVIGEASRLYRHEKDGMEIVVKAFDVSQFDSGEVEIEIDNLSNLRHPLIAAPIGFAVVDGKLRIGRLHAAGGAGSLAEVVSSNPAWWTPTAKAKAVVGIVLALRFSHGFGLLHGCLNSGNVLFDGERRIQIADFSPMRRGGGGFSGKHWSPRADFSAFARLLFEIVAGPPWSWPSASASETDAEVILPPDVPAFVSELISRALPPNAGREPSFIAIFEILQANHFQILAGVDSDEVSAFVRGVESATESRELK